MYSKICSWSLADSAFMVAMTALFSFVYLGGLSSSLSLFLMKRTVHANELLCTLYGSISVSLGDKGIALTSSTMSSLFERYCGRLYSLLIPLWSQCSLPGI